jgi:hypothetical protein
MVRKATPQEEANPQRRALRFLPAREGQGKKNRDSWPRQRSAWQAHAQARARCIRIFSFVDWP